MTDPILEVRNLSTHFFTDDGEVKAVRGVNFSVAPGETLGIVGESGCGKSVTAMSVLGLVQRPGKVVSGEIMFKGRDLLKLTKEELRNIRGRDIAMIFQDPLSSLNPVLRVGFQIDEAMHAHDKIPSEDRSSVVASSCSSRCASRTRSAGIKDFPHQFSGGMRQRAMIAMGLSNRPDLLIADEPTTALDVTVQAQILELLRDLNEQTGAAIILITHNLGVVAGLCKRVWSCTRARSSRREPPSRSSKSPQHPYTWSLLRSVPRIDRVAAHRLLSIEGLPPDLIDLPAGVQVQPALPIPRSSVLQRNRRRSSTSHLQQQAACWVTMERAYAEMGARDDHRHEPGCGERRASGRPEALPAVEMTAAALAEPRQ